MPNYHADDVARARTKAASDVEWIPADAMGTLRSLPSILFRFLPDFLFVTELICFHPLCLILQVLSPTEIEGSLD